MDLYTVLGALKHKADKKQGYWGHLLGEKSGHFTKALIG